MAKPNKVRNRTKLRRRWVVAPYVLAFFFAALALSASGGCGDGGGRPIQRDACISCDAYEPQDAGAGSDAPTHCDAQPETDAHLSGDAASGDGGGGDPVCGEPPADLTHYLTGAAQDSDASPLGPKLLVAGGGPDVDAAFEGWLQSTGGGDVVVLRTSGSDGYNDYLFSDLGGVDSVETLLVTSRSLADAPYVACRVRTAEGVFMAGGDQADYLANWENTQLSHALQEAHDQGAALGGTSAGAAVMGEFIFSAENGTVYSDEALQDPYNQYMTFSQSFVSLSPLAGVLVDTHFYERDRMGRLVGFLAHLIQENWASEVLGLGVDEATALLISSDGFAEVIGDGYVYVLESAGPPQVCTPAQALTYQNLQLTPLIEGDTLQLPAGTSSISDEPLSAETGTLVPANPY